MQFLLFWIIRPRFGVFSFACIITALLIPPIFGVLLAASSVFIETVLQSVYKQAILRRIQKNHIDF